MIERSAIRLAWSILILTVLIWSYGPKVAALISDPLSGMPY